MQFSKLVLFVSVILIVNINMLHVASAKALNATVTDINGIETEVNSLWIRDGGSYYYALSDFSLKVGEASQDVPFSLIKEIDLEANPNDKEHQIVEITSISGKTLKGISELSSTACSFDGKTDFGDFALDLAKTKKVVFET